MTNALTDFSNALAKTVADAGPGLVRVEAETGRCAVFTGTVDPPVVADTGTQPLHIHMPGEEGAMHLGVERNDLRRLRAVYRLEQQEFDAGRVAAEDRKVAAAGVRSGTEGIPEAGPG